MAPPIAYSENGRRYITVLTGSDSQGGGIMATGNTVYRTDYALPRRILTFAIDGDAELPDFEMPARTPPADPDFEPEEERVMAGALTFCEQGQKTVSLRD